MNIDIDGSLKLIAVCVALSAYISNIRRDMAKRCTTLKNENKGNELLKVKKNIGQLRWGDVPLVFASISILVHWMGKYAFSGSGQPTFLYIAMVLFGFAVLALACLHGKEWIRKDNDN